MRSILASLCVASVAAAPTLAQSVIVPAANATARGVSGLNTLTRGTANPRTYMLGIAAANLAAIPNGAVITGVSFRSSVTASNLASWPAADTNWADYEVTLGNAIPLASWTGNFPSNFAG